MHPLYDRCQRVQVNRITQKLQRARSRIRVYTAFPCLRREYTAAPNLIQPACLQVWFPVKFPSRGVGREQVTGNPVSRELSSPF